MSLNRFRCRLSTAFALAVTVIVAPSLCAQTSGTWTGTSGTDSNWSTVANWNGGQQPTNGGSVTFNSASTANLTTNNDLITSLASILDAAGAAGPITIGGNALTLTGATGINLTGATQDLSITSNLSVGNTAQGWTNITARNITIGASNANTLFLSNTTASNTLTITVSSTSGSVTFNSVIADSSAAGAAPSNLAVASTGTSNTGSTIVFNAANTYSGTTTLSGRATIYQIGSNSPFGTSSVATPLTGFVPQFQSINGNHTINNAINLSGGIVFSGSNNLTFSGAVSTSTSRAITYSGAAGTILDLSGPVTIGTSGAAAGTLTTSIVAGTTAATGSIVFDGVVADAAGVTSGAVILLSNGTGTAAFSSDQFNNQNTFSGGITASGAFATIIAGSSSTVVSGAIQSGPFGKGAVTINNAGFPPRVQAANGPQNVANNFTLTSSMQFQGSNNLTLSGILSSTGSLIVAGPGTLNLTGANTYSGNSVGTSITGGTLTANNVSGTSATGTSAVSVTGTGTAGSGGTLGGAGFISGNVTISTATVGATSGGTIAPGNSPGTLTMTGSSVTTFNPVGSYFFDYDATATGPTAPVGGGSDLLKGTGTSSLSLANLSSSAQFNLVLNAIGAPTLPAGSVAYTIADFSSSANATPIVLPAGFVGTNLTTLFNVTGQFNVVQTPTVSLVGGNQIQVAFTPVPEPAFILAACGGFSGLLLWRRSRRRSPNSTALAI